MTPKPTSRRPGRPKLAVKNKVSRVNVTLYDDQKRRLDAFCIAEKKSRGKMIAQLVDDYNPF